jgi:prepilin-type N-terminal cleavage/methylation domain-containing protein
MSAPKGFSLVEVMVALALGGVVTAAAVTSFKASLDEQGISKRDWAAFTIAQQTMELVSSVPNDDSRLSANSTAALPGSAGDAECASITSTSQHFTTDELGVPTLGGPYEVCIKVNNANPFGQLKNVRVVVLYTAPGARHVILQTIR